MSSISNMQKSGAQRKAQIQRPAKPRHGTLKLSVSPKSPFRSGPWPYRSDPHRNFTYEQGKYKSARCARFIHAPAHELGTPAQQIRAQRRTGILLLAKNSFTCATVY